LLQIDFPPYLLAGQQVFDRAPQVGGDALHDRIRLRMDGAGIQRIGGVAHTQKAGRLLIRFGPQPGHLPDLLS